jgi:hypothetical protein
MAAQCIRRNTLRNTHTATKFCKDLIGAYNLMPEPYNAGYGIIGTVLSELHNPV